MIKEAYVSFETAKLLKEKGFDELFFFFYRTDDEEKNVHHAVVSQPLSYHQKCMDEEVIAAPTIQMAVRWLREVHNIAIDTEWEHLWYAYVKPMTSNPSEKDYYQSFSSNYEEAVEAAIKYYVENLI